MLTLITLFTCTIAIEWLAEWLEILPMVLDQSCWQILPQRCCELDEHPGLFRYHTIFTVSESNPTSGLLILATSKESLLSACMSMLISLLLLESSSWSWSMSNEECSSSPSPPFPLFAPGLTKCQKRAQLNHILPGWRRNVRHGNRIAKSIGTRGKREYVGVWGGQVGHGVVARVDVAAHVKALWIYLPLQASGNVKIFLDIQLVTEGRVHKSSRICFVIQWIRVKILLMFEGK